MHDNPRIQCYSCGNFGHIAYNCPDPPRAPGQEETAAVEETQPEVHADAEIPGDDGDEIGGDSSTGVSSGRSRRSALVELGEDALIPVEITSDAEFDPQAAALEQDGEHKLVKMVSEIPAEHRSSDFVGRLRKFSTDSYPWFFVPLRLNGQRTAGLLDSGSTTTLVDYRLVKRVSDLLTWMTCESQLTSANGEPLP